MKKVFFSFLAILGLCLFVFNLTLKSSATASNEVKLSNIHALQASAGEAWCDGSSTSVCTIEVGGVKGTGTGQPHIKN
jgi:hypothetical protein